MQNIKSKIAALVLALGVVLGGFAAPSQADVTLMRTGSTVSFDHKDGSIPNTIDFRVVKVSGSFFYLSWTETLSNVKYVCPKSDDYKINYWRDGYTKGRTLAPGECLWPAFKDRYHVGYYRA